MIRLRLCLAWIFTEQRRAMTAAFAWGAACGGLHGGAVIIGTFGLDWYASGYENSSWS
jgi:hypothetical protein